MVRSNGTLAIEIAGSLRSVFDGLWGVSQQSDFNAMPLYSAMVLLNGILAIEMAKDIQGSNQHLLRVIPGSGIKLPASSVSISAFKRPMCH